MATCAHPITRIANHKVDLVDMMLNLDILSSVSLLSKEVLVF
jgi:hypothetical protein